MIYVTFFVYGVDGKYRYAVACNNKSEANEVAYDLNSLQGVGNIRLRNSKPADRKIIKFEEYYKYNTWYNV